MKTNNESEKLLGNQEIGEAGRTPEEMESGSVAMIEKIENVNGEMRKEKVPFEEVPEEVKRIFSEEINWVEQGFSCDLSTVRGFQLQKDGETLIQKTGSAWNFIPHTIWFADPIAIEVIEDLKKVERMKEGIEEMEWSEFLRNCDVGGYWEWSFGSHGEIIEADPTDDPEFVIYDIHTVSWGGGKVYITDEIGTGYVILERIDQGNGCEKYVPYRGAIFSTEEEAQKFKKEYEDDFEEVEA